MKIASRRLASFLGLGALTALTAVLAPACAADPTDGEKVEATDETSSAFSLKSTTIVGSLDYGQTSPLTQYTKKPRYRAYKFAGNEGDEIDVWVRSSNGDPVTWILDNDWHVVAKNDDAAPGDTSSHVKATLPANASITHYIVVRDYWQDPMSFTVELQGGPKDFASGCKVDADCAKVEKGCCDYQGWTAVLGKKANAYEASLHCQEPQICPKIAVRPDYSAAECNNGTHKCELVQPQDIKCGGFMLNSHSCPAGYRCQLPIGKADVPGTCVQFCGGIAGIACHDPNDECVDDPNDGCDPNAGGADCGGICQPKAPPPPPPPPADCRQNGCAAGQWCSFCWGSYACIPNGAMC